MRARYVLPNYRIAVVGAGAIGSYYGAKLAYFGRDVHFLIRSGLAEVRKFGISVRSPKENFRVAKVPAYLSTTEIGPVDLVLIALKATANDALDELLPPLLHEKTALLTLQNGLGNEQFLADRFGAGRVMGGLCFICLNRVAPGKIEQIDRGHLRLGEFDGFPKPRTHDVAWEFKRCGVVCSVAENLQLERWRKLVWNIPFNGLTITEGGVTTEDIVHDARRRLLALEIMDEVIASANALGVRLPTTVALDQMKRTETMGPYQPSTLRDFEMGRPLELEAIWGEPLRRALAAGVNVPRLAELYAQLQTLNSR
ncbi:MAG: 2-dehydropantoate 2-reductase [Verrucomicrobiota bacterium]|nr:2-dehydropantoate 2-reductase [Verrucomicrobiota bacterium]